jgi:hypothetical protein
MKENYRRTLTSWLRQIESEIFEVREPIEHPREDALLVQRSDDSRESALMAIDAVLSEIAAIANDFALAKSEEDVIWSADVQLLTAEISVGELLPERWPSGPTAIGDEAEAAAVGEALHRLLSRIREARATLRRRETGTPHGP